MVVPSGHSEKVLKTEVRMIT